MKPFIYGHSTNGKLLVFEFELAPLCQCRLKWIRINEPRVTKETLCLSETTNDVLSEYGCGQYGAQLGEVSFNLLAIFCPLALLKPVLEELDCFCQNSMHHATPNVHNEGRAPLLRASLSIVLLAVLTRLA